MQLETVRISRRFQGPPRSGNGGYACGLTARNLEGAATVRLKAPPPLETDLRLVTDECQAWLFNDEVLIAQAWTAEVSVSPPVAPPYELACNAAKSFVGFNEHLFPSCFVCGPERLVSDGLRIFPGPLPGTNAIAAPWTPDQSLANPSGHVDPIYLWSALDCPSSFALIPLPEGLGIVLGELSTSVLRNVSPGDALEVVAWPIDIDGRKRFAGSAIFTADGRLVAKAYATWIEIPLNQWQ